MITIPKNWHEPDFITPMYPGCYAIYLHNMVTDRWRLIYIGTASNLFNRLCNHNIYNRKFKFPYETMVKVKVVNGGRFKLEKKLIKRLKPILNKTYNK